jgi:glycosyltransferase involved in cell wall biosynthesis
MKLNAIVMVKNEADIIEETLLHALAFCDGIFVFDNGSNDGTSEILERMSGTHNKIVVDFSSDCPYRNQLRNRIYNKRHMDFSDEDWWYILDADEMLVEDPRPYLERARERGYSCMSVWQAQFYFTDEDYQHYQFENK